MSEQNLLEIIQERRYEIPPELRNMSPVVPVLVEANTLSLKHLDYTLGPFHIYGDYEIFSPNLDIKLDVTAFGHTVTIGQIQGTKGCVGKDFGLAKVQACLEIKNDGIYLAADAFSYHYAGKIVAWSLPVSLKPQIASTILTMQPKVENRQYLDVTLRNPETHEHSGLHLSTSSITKGTVIPFHQHYSDLIHICIEGEIEWQIKDGESMRMRQGDVIQIPANTAYQVTAIEDSKTVAGCILVYW